MKLLAKIGLTILLFFVCITAEILTVNLLDPSKFTALIIGLAFSGLFLPAYYYIWN